VALDEDPVQELSDQQAAFPGASQSPRPPTSLPELIATSLAVHPSIAAARQKIAAMQNRIPQARALADPMLGNTFWPIHAQALQTAGGRMGHQFSLSQSVPWPAKLEARGTIAAREVQVAAAELARVEQETIEAVRLAYYELWLADALRAIVEKNRDVVKDLIVISEARYRNGGSQQDILRAELEADRLDQQLIALQRQREQAQADLGVLVGQPLEFVPTTTSELDADEAKPILKDIVELAEQCNPTLRGLAAEIARDRSKESLAHLQQYPDFQIGLGYSIVSDEPDAISPVADGHDNINFSVGVTLPIYREKINAGIREAAHARTSSFHRRQAEQDKLGGQLRRQVAAAYAAIEQLELLRERLLPRTRQTLEVATADYQGQRADFTDLIATYRELLALEVQVVRAKAELASTLAAIQKNIGCNLF
jgi:outer membrane protein TolC